VIILHSLDRWERQEVVAAEFDKIKWPEMGFFIRAGCGNGGLCFDSPRTVSMLGFRAVTWTPGPLKASHWPLHLLYLTIKRLAGCWIQGST